MSLHGLFSMPSAMNYVAPRGVSVVCRLNGELGDEPQTEWRGQIQQHLFRGAPPLKPDGHGLERTNICKIARSRLILNQSYLIPEL